MSELSRAATEDTQQGCSSPGSPRMPWARFTVVSGFFLLTDQMDTELWRDTKVKATLCNNLPLFEATTNLYPLGTLLMLIFIL